MMNELKEFFLEGVVPVMAVLAFAFALKFLLS